jgi:hypothetical protein
MRVEWIDDGTLSQELDRIGMQVGEWRRLEYRSEQQRADQNWRNAAAPRNASELLTFSQNCVDWLPDAERYLIVFDNSNVFHDVQLVVLTSIMGHDLEPAAQHSGGLAVTAEDPRAFRITLSYFVMFGLMFAAHARIVSARAPAGPILALSDEYAYFVGADAGDAHLDAFIASLQAGKEPAWAWGRWPGEPPP